MKTGDRRITINHMPSKHHTHRTTRVTFEWVDMDGNWSPHFHSEKTVLTKFLKMDLGFTNKIRNEVDWPNSYLEYLKMLDAKEGAIYAQKHKLTKPLASIWEFCIVAPSTD